MGVTLTRRALEALRTWKQLRARVKGHLRARVKEHLGLRVKGHLRVRVKGHFRVGIKGYLGRDVDEARIGPRYSNP